ncbi:hypothetical protein NKG94_17030 [Micromonospora sp. M12]
MAAAPSEQPELDVERTAEQANQLHAAGEFRAAARQWRRLAEHQTERRGADDPLVFEFRLRAARAHVPLGEHDRALRQLNLLLQDRIHADGPRHAAVLDLQQEIEQLSKQRPAPRQSSRHEAQSDR